MKIPIVTSDPQIFTQIAHSVAELRRTVTVDRALGRKNYQAIHIPNPQAAIEYIIYEMPQLIVLSFSDDQLDGFDILERIVADPWLNNAGIIALAGDSSVAERIGELQNTNIVFTMSLRDIPRQMIKVLDVIHHNEQILFQRAIQRDFISRISGEYVLDLDLLIIPLYANLIANYLYNIGFVDGEKKYHVSLILTEMLANAIEHGNCGVTYEEKSRALENGGSMQAIIEQRAKDPHIGKRKVYFSYEIEEEHSRYVIRDEGQGFAWQKYVDPDREIDHMAPHGRGILMTVLQAHALTYNDKGNEATIAFRHNVNTSNTVPGAFRDSEIVNIAPEQIVFTEGEESDFVYYVADGEYRVVVGEKIVAKVTPADILIGEMSFLLQDTRSATVIADTPGKLIRISRENFVNGIKRHPYYGLFLAKLLAQRLDRASRRFEQLSLKE
ncbi:MAG: cyclic nucleotide-binding domain-containing protein [Candidatus Lambdaproteobacteria bacterium]|nr:cyclic nucleotide-binding domain-containing protein [Candidatus Lambdaproteobacteria bacterium]